MGAIEIKLPEIKLDPETIGFVQRILGPLAEAGDFLSEKIRFYRWQSSIKTMQRAEEIARAHGIEPKQIPLKTLVPLLEKSSLEDENSSLLEKWATLLAQAAADPNSVHAMYIDVLSRLLSEDVAALEIIIPRSLIEGINNSNIADKVRAAVVHISAVRDVNHDRVRREINAVIGSKSKSEYYEALKYYIFGLSEYNGTVIIVEAGINFEPFEKDDLCVFTELFTNVSSLDVLESCGLIARPEFRYPVTHGEAYVSFAVPTAFGIGFIAACRGDGLKKAAMTRASQPRERS